jgi:hypothetical protein
MAELDSHALDHKTAWQLAISNRVRENGRGYARLYRVLCRWQSRDASQQLRLNADARAARTSDVNRQKWRMVCSIAVHVVSAPARPLAKAYIGDFSGGGGRVFS